MASHGSSSAASSGSRTDGLAVASPCCGIVGLFVLDIVLGVVLWLGLPAFAAGSGGFSWYVGGQAVWRAERRGRRAGHLASA